ncbi:hypothetical protein [Paraburkholderia caribensis]|uniref:hypothetical protein n=1 Tax=Paraburkholderia caribensis TaxID=75105 RepID=UPI0015905AA4|nr:hypothetical protein [Paraburkholderia caribensis]
MIDSKIAALEDMLSPRPSDSLVRVNIEVTPILREDLKAYAKARNTTISKVLRAMLQLHLYPERNQSQD